MLNIIRKNYRKYRKMENIADDIFVEILLFLKPNYILSLEMTAKSLEMCWKIYAYRKWGNREFWERAAKRPVAISKPLGTWKKEVVRLWEFEYYLGQTWTREDYYEFWKLRDRVK